jgi:hypothetical protein
VGAADWPRLGTNRAEDGAPTGTEGLMIVAGVDDRGADYDAGLIGRLTRMIRWKEFGLLS